MGDKQFTLLALHVNDLQIGPERIGGSDEDATESSGGKGLPIPPTRGRRLPVGLKPLIAGLFGIGILGGIAVAAKFLLGNEDPEQVALDDPTFEEES